ncbi:hypothetical protein C8R44DRAFT_753251 [Mycena epipterygia]|nr:hypothetical protein C8R44DRAFT_753251 [Mycena epipterygia]
MYVILGRITVEVEGSVEGDQVEDARGDLHASEMTNMGLQLEEQQWALEFTLPQIARRQIAGWVDLLALFTLAVTTLHMADKAWEEAVRLQPIPAVPVHAFKLWLPSKLAAMPWITARNIHGRYKFELHGYLHGKMKNSDLYKFIPMDDLDPRAQNLKPGSVAYPWEDVLGSAMAWLTLSALGAKLKENNWKKELRVLTPDNVRGRPQGTFSDPRHKQQNKKRKREADVQAEECRKEEERPASWIWMSQLSSAEDMEKGMMEALRIEWAKRQAGVAVDEGGDASRAPVP